MPWVQRQGLGNSPGRQIGDLASLRQTTSASPEATSPQQNHFGEVGMREPRFLSTPTCDVRIVVKGYGPLSLRLLSNPSCAGHSFENIRDLAIMICEMAPTGTGTCGCARPTVA